MSKLDDLINKLCPDGVEYKTLENCCEILDTQRKPISKAAREVGDYPYYGANGIQDYVSNYIFDGTFVLIGEDGSVLTPNGNPVVNWATGKIWVNNHAHILSEKENVSLRYLFHYVQIINIKELVHGNIPKLTQGDLRNLEIPVPPLEIQNEIVRILDNFTELEEELEEELVARRKQYEYYRDSLLTFDDSVEWKTLEELCTKVTDGSHFSPKATEEGYPMPSVKDMRFNNFDLSNCKRISEKDYNELVKSGCKPLLNDVLIAKDGSMLKYAFPIKEELDLVILSSIAILRPKINLISPDYFAHYFRQDSFREIVIRDYSSKGGVPRIVLKNFKKIEIPVPTLEKQKQIVTILDRFEALCNDITSGLPAEIAARHKQYEYYRDKLLTFKRKDEK